MFNFNICSSFHRYSFRKDIDMILTYCRATLLHLVHPFWSNVVRTNLCTATGCFRLGLAAVALVIQAAGAWVDESLRC